MRSVRRPPLLIITDMLEDIDDATAITLAVSKVRQGQIDLSGVLSTYIIPRIRNNCVGLMLHNLGVKGVPTAEGAVFPPGKEDFPAVDEYLRSYTVNNRLFQELGLLSPQDTGLPPTWKTPAELIHRLIDRAEGHLNILLIAPATDLALAIQQDRTHFEQGVDSICISGQAKIVNNILEPDFAAHNLNVDQDASREVFSVQRKVPFTLLGKWAAYQTPLYDYDFERFAGTGHAVGKFLKRSAELGIVRLCQRNLGKFTHLYSEGIAFNPADPLRTIIKRSYPYDPLALLAFTDPGIFDRSIQFGRHTLIGMTENNPGMSQPDLVKTKLMDDILFALGEK